MRWIWNHSLRSLCIHSSLFVHSWPCTGHTFRECSNQATVYAADLGQEACLGSRGCGCAHHVHPLHLQRSDPATLLPSPLFCHPPRLHPRHQPTPSCCTACLCCAPPWRQRLQPRSSQCPIRCPLCAEQGNPSPPLLSLVPRLSAIPRVGTAAVWVRVRLHSWRHTLCARV